MCFHIGRLSYRTARPKLPANILPLRGHVFSASSSFIKAAATRRACCERQMARTRALNAVFPKAGRPACRSSRSRWRNRFRSQAPSPKLFDWVQIWGPTRMTERTWRRGTRRHDNVSLYVHTAILYQSRVYPKPSHRKLPANILLLRGHRRYESFDTFCVHVENDFGVN